MTVIIFRWMEVYPEKKDGTLHHACSALFDMYRPFFWGIPPSTEKLLQLLLIIKFKTHYKCLEFSLTLTLPTALLLTLLTLYFQFCRWRYTLFVLTNQNRYYMSKLNDHPVCPSVHSKLNLDHNFWTKRDKAFMLNTSIPCDKTFLLVPKFFTLWPWPWLLTFF